MDGCRGCGCPESCDVHAVVAALVAGDVDAAIGAGLLEVDPCPACSAACLQRVLAVRSERRVALAARERFRTRQVRVERRALERRSRTRVAASSTPSNPTPLPTAAADALQRALQRAAKPAS